MTVNIHYKNAQRVFERTIFHNSEDEINNLASNMLLLSENNLGKLNDTLISNSQKSTRNIWDF